MTPHSTPISDWTPRFCAPLPSGLREHVEGMPWSAFVAAYSPSGGPVRLGSWQCDDAHRSASRLGPQPRRFRATLAIGDRIETAIAHAGGPVAALTAMLYERGIGVEMTRFHQLASGADTATFIQGCDGQRREWAMGWSEDPTQSALRAVIACTNRLLTQTHVSPGKVE
ncbi:homocitrate synthase [Mycolicibacterium sp. CH28]|uniref:homocitrate synthase n=1 Tax=Mycolicibacterium sp. CH28 TaxID=2512237 RepID=UPI0010822319|nr:homocitrate synthase [Mycolicibacterium sp. CH28]TGD84878.1 homocitrate synthase [Mycolicibacterium sp. CH28]